MSVETPEVVVDVAPPGQTVVGWRPRTVIASLVAVLAVVGLVLGFLAVTRPIILPGSVITAGHGITPLTDGLETTRWVQTTQRAFVSFTVRNAGDRTVTLTSALDPQPGPNAMPRQSLGFLADVPPYGGVPPTLETADPSGLLTSIVVEPGAEVYVVLKVYFPCIAPLSDLARSTRYQVGGVPVTATVLGRSTALDIPLPYQLEVPRDSQRECTAELFTP
jgi:hypothetical protein